jgi:hypothetical protein
LSKNLIFFLIYFSLHFTYFIIIFRFKTHFNSISLFLWLFLFPFCLFHSVLPNLSFFLFLAPSLLFYFLLQRFQFYLFIKIFSPLRYPLSIFIFLFFNFFSLSEKYFLHLVAHYSRYLLLFSRSNSQLHTSKLKHDVNGKLLVTLCMHLI